MFIPLVRSQLCRPWLDSCLEKTFCLGFCVGNGESQRSSGHKRSWDPRILKLTWNPPNGLFGYDMTFLFQLDIFRLHVSFRGCSDPLTRIDILPTDPFAAGFNTRNQTKAAKKGKEYTSLPWKEYISNPNVVVIACIRNHFHTCIMKYRIIVYKYLVMNLIRLYYFI